MHALSVREAHSHASLMPLPEEKQPLLIITLTPPDLETQKRREMKGFQPIDKFLEITMAACGFFASGSFKKPGQQRDPTV